ncbi:MAG: bifunctional folylpolyglutamate synthase/dihydrofolate synthase [Pirellulales bacterium]|nr:bifunctional folylpolyglutamate synthase/dihydrofolate synthase [Pirellulales bacterium]
MNDSPGHAEALAFLFGRIDYERALWIPYHRREFRLDRMRDLLARLGNPQEKLRIVHVAGTKGKGSTSAMIAAALTAAGYRTGLYTSPHLERIEERIQVDCQMCAPVEFVALVRQAQPIVEQMDQAAARHEPMECGPTYFEITTALAMLHFANVNTDAAVLEVGLGGRLDSTNVCRPMVSAITSISFDHTKQLGNTLAAIAEEKAGIIKPGVPVVSGVVDAEPRRVIERVAQESGSRLVQLGVDFSYHYAPPREVNSQDAAHGVMDFESRNRVAPQRIGQIELGLLGRHQASNAAVALATLDELRAQGWNLSEHAVRRGLAELRWPGRIEIVSRQPTVVVDAAHNLASIESLIETLNESFTAPHRLLVFATTQDKDVGGMLRRLLPQFETVILTRYENNPRAVGLEQLGLCAAEISSIPRFECENPAAAWDVVHRLATPNHLICATGSFFLAAEMRAEIARRPLQLGRKFAAA